MWKASQSHFAVIVWRKPDWSVLNWIRSSETAVSTLYYGPEASPRPRIGCEILLFPPLEAGIASFPRALRLEKGARKGRMWPRAGRRDYLMGIKCPWWSHLKAPLACRAFVCVLKLCLENDLLLIFIYFFFFSPPHSSSFSLPQGHNCEIPINACISFPCANGGTCHIQPGLEEHFRYDQNHQ